MGGSKLFRENFSTVGLDERVPGQEEIDTTQNGNLTLSAAYDTRSESDPFRFSAWYATGSVEWSNKSFASDFDYTRWLIGLRRYQKIQRYITLLLRGMYGGSDGHLPLYKRFYVGGLGTLRGYKHKEVHGTKFWMGNAEYRIRYPRTDIAASVIWDVAQVAEHTGFSEADVKHSLGVAAYIGNNLRVSIAKRLDRSYDAEPKIYVRFDHVF